MIENQELINKIFNNDPKKRLKIKNKEDKTKLSQYEEVIPMYDIYSDKIYPISRENVYSRLIYGHYRFINEEVKNWIENKYRKDQEKNQYNIDIIDNYNLDELLKTSTKVLYESSTQLGLSISICKRNSFNKYSQHLLPYYSRDELIKLGQNMEIIKNINKININDQETHYKICKKISTNDISAQEILSHNNYIIEKDLVSAVCNYSFMGSYFMNQYLRNNKNTSLVNINLINLLSKNLVNTPPLKNDYFLYRFIWDDFFIKDLKIGEIFTDKGFISTTRDPFYSPGLKSNFGLILVKIKIPKNKNVGLLIENFSLFPKEEEFLLPPNSRFKLLTKNEKFKYFHTNLQFENFITKKFEFEYIDNKFEEILFQPQYVFQDFTSFNFVTDSKINIIKQFISSFESNGSSDSDYNINLNFKDRKYSIYYNWFDGTDNYSKFYYNQNNNGILFTIYDERYYPYLNIEFGDEMVVNYLNQFYYGQKEKVIDSIDFEFLMQLSNKFKYQSFLLYLEYDNFSEFIKEENEENQSYLYSRIYCKSIYQYFKNNQKFYSNIKEINSNSSYQFGYWQLDKLKRTKIPKEIFNRYDVNNFIKKTDKISDLIIKIIENHFYDYSNLINLLDQNKIPNPLKNTYLKMDTLKFFDFDTELKIKIPYNKDFVENDDNFKLIFRQPIRRIV